MASLENETTSGPDTHSIFNTWPAFGKRYATPDLIIEK